MPKAQHAEIVAQLDKFYIQAKRQILQNQSAITGLFPANSSEKSDASIKTSLWAASSIYALYLAYSKRVDNDQGKAHDLGQSVVKCMRGILFAWMRQSKKVESFKANQCPKHALHLKFDLHSGLANDFEYPHLQIDVVSLYLIFLSNFIASGLDIIYCMDEVTFIQNLVYYVERAYRTPDYGNWEPTLQLLAMAQKQAPPSQYSNQTNINNLTSEAAAAAAAAANHNYHHHHQQQQQQQQAFSSTITNEFYPPQAHSSSTQAPHYQHQHSSTQAPASGHHNQEPINYHQPNACVHCSNEGQQLEIHATSIGMAKAALEAINGCNLFGGKGANWSIIYSDIDAHSRNRSIFETLLPRESRSKNTDSYLLATISWPCFATNDHALYSSTKSKILRKLRGKYGLRRFLRDPYGTVLNLDTSKMQSAAGPGSGSAPVSSTPLIGSTAAGGATDRNTPLSCSTPLSMSTTIHPMMSGSPSIILAADNSFDSTYYGREASFSSTTSGSSASLGEQPRTKQRKSSYHQRKNYFRNQQAAGDALINQQQQQQQQQQQGGGGLQQIESSSKMSKRFEHIESEWPLFVCFLIIDGIFKQDMEQIHENEKLLYERLLKIEPKHGDYLMPKYYYVPPELIYNEKCNPDSVERVASLEGSSNDQLYITGQSILLVARLLLAGLLHPNELDPLRRHMPSHDRPKRIGRYSSFQANPPDLVVQTVLIAESIRLQAMMANYGIQTQTPREVEPVQIWSSGQLVKVYEYLGVNQKLGLKGRPARPIGALGTSKLYRICGQTIICYPLIFEVSDFYLAQDMLLLIDDIQNELNFIGRYWRMSGRPTVCIIIREEHLRDVHFRDLLDLLVQFKNGQLKKSGLRIKTGRLQNLISSSCIEHLDFLHLLPHEHLPQFKSFRQLVESPKQSLLLTPTSRTTSYSGLRHRNHMRNSVSGVQSGSAANTGGGGFGDTLSVTGATTTTTTATTTATATKSSRRIFLSSSSNNLQAIEEQANMSCEDTCDDDDDDDDDGADDDGGGGGDDHEHNNHREHGHENEHDQNADSDKGNSAHDATVTGAGFMDRARRRRRRRKHLQLDIEEESLQKFAEQLDFNMSDASMYKFNSLDLEHNYSTEQCNSIDYYECYKDAPTWPTLIELLKTCNELGGQSQLLAILWEREGAKYVIDDTSVEDRLEQVSQAACQTRNWSVVRYCSSVLKRSVESLSPWLTSILVNGKQISLGTSVNERIINNPLTPTEIHTLIYSTVSTKNPCDAVLQQEIALYIGRLISTRPDYFDGILTIRVANFMSAMRSYLNIKNNEKKLKLQQQQEEALAKFEEQQVKQQQMLMQQQQQQHSQKEPSDELLDLRIKQEHPSTTTGNPQLQLTPPPPPHQDGHDGHYNANVPQQQQQQTGPQQQSMPSMLPPPPSIKVEQHQQHQSVPQPSRSSLYQQAHAATLTKFNARYGRRAAQNLVARPLESLSPSDVRKLLIKVLSVDDSLLISDRRQITGELCRVPKDFYDKVWSLLHCTNVGVVIGGRILRSAPILTNMTQDDLNFALKVESILNSIEDPKLRQINVELLMALHVLFERNPEIRFDSEPLDLDKIIQLSLDKFRRDFGRDDYGLREFYSNTTETAVLYTVRTVFDCLLPAKYRAGADTNNTSTTTSVAAGATKQQLE